MYLTQFFVEGLGHASCLIASDHTKVAAVDPGREIQRTGYCHTDPEQLRVDDAWQFLLPGRRCH